MNQGDMIGELNPPLSATPTFIHILRETVISASMRGPRRGIPGIGSSLSLDPTHGSQPWCGEGVVFSPWTMKGERPLSRFMHYVEGEAPQDRGVVCGSPIYICFETGCFMPGSPRGTLQIPSRLRATQPLRSRRADHIRALSCQPCWGRPQ